MYCGAAKYFFRAILLKELVCKSIKKISKNIKIEIKGDNLIIFVPGKKITLFSLYN